ncbi:MBL fold metallo-hydrolase [Paracoccus thiocyanatus]|uniref:MBL fold metallo-hydrolase n=1 Tax=Paracoccus thiocyanatus TaxID=34006 RepID=A0A3D8PFD4_9RHOB|nr:MBL fold metallo-hydrolase [Paracoccus thiocyanatus]RDW14774.1 MBL fold metallo-hydrolase [Paracoccus thiocyanatus]
MGLNPGFHHFRIGQIRATVLYDGWLDHPLDGFLGGPRDEIARFQRDHFLSETRWPMDENCLFVQIGDQNILIDTGLGARRWFGGHGGRLQESMAEAGIDPASVTLVLLTHADTDHAFGLVDAQGRRVFPQARIAVSKLEYEHWVDGIALDGKRPNPEWRSVTMRALAAYREGAIWLQDGDRIVPGLTAIATPGHSPGHFAFRLESEGDILYVLGDAVHHQVIELARPDWPFLWDFDPDLGVRSKRKILAMAAAEGALCHGFHFPWPGLGRLRRDGQGYVWVPRPLTL